MKFNHSFKKNNSPYETLVNGALLRRVVRESRQNYIISRLGLIHKQAILLKYSQTAQVLKLCIDVVGK